MKGTDQEVFFLKQHIQSCENMFECASRLVVRKRYLPILWMMKRSSCKGIIVYPEAISWEPVQRPQQMLMEFARQGYVCFFCQHDAHQEGFIKQIQKNLYLVNKQETLLPLLQHEDVIVYMTYFLQGVYAKYIPCKKVWVDVVDRLDFFAFYNSYSEQLWKKIIREADLVTYSASNLQEYVIDRRDAILLPNASNPDDFKIRKQVVPGVLQEFVHNGKKTIGYFGAIEEWFDFELLQKIDQLGQYNILVIGKKNENIDIISYQYEHVIFTGPIAYQDLKNYATNFDIAIIPFLVNDLTNSVSPVKFFDYLALGKPVVSTDIAEMRKFAYEEVVRVAVNHDDFIKKIEEVGKLDRDFVKIQTQKLLKNHTWSSRASVVCEHFKGWR